MKRLIACGAVDDGGMISISHRERFIERWKEQFKGQHFVLFVEKATRTLRQNALYAVWVDQISRELGWDPDYVRWYNKENFNRKSEWHANKETGELVEVSWPGDTHDLPIDEFNAMLERVQRGWAEQGLNLEWPDEFRERQNDNSRTGSA